MTVLSVDRPFLMPSEKPHVVDRRAIGGSGDGFKVGGASSIHTVNNNCWSLKFMRERRMRSLSLGIATIAVGTLAVIAQPASAADVKVTPFDWLGASSASSTAP